MTDPTTEIAPRIVDGEPTCSGEACPAYMERKTFRGYVSEHQNVQRFCMAIDRCIDDVEICIPMLRRLLATRTEERDAARHELCKLAREESGLMDGNCRYAESRGWSYLYGEKKG